MEIRPSGRNRGLPLRRRRGQGPHLAKRWEPRGFSRVAFRMDWLDLLAVQGTLKSLLQHHIGWISPLLSTRFHIADHLATVTFSKVIKPGLLSTKQKLLPRCHSVLGILLWNPSKLICRDRKQISVFSGLQRGPSPPAPNPSQHQSLFQ